MSDGLRVIAAAIAAGSAGVLMPMQAEMFQGDEVTALNFVRGYYRQYRELPESRTVQEETGVRLPVANEALSFYVDRVYERHEYNQIRERFAALRDGLSTMNMAAVGEAVTEMHRVTRTRNRRGLESMDIRGAMALVNERLESTRGYGGITGVESGWAGYDQITGGYQDGDLISMVGRMGTGKCMDPDTPVLMHSGAVRRIGDIVVGDRLMGPDSLPRTVLGTTTGVDPMFRITPSRGEPFVCNGAHILVLACDFDTDSTHVKGSTHYYSVDAFLSLPVRVQKILRVVRAEINFTHSDVEVSPYYVGLWLGDGCVANGRISTVDPEIRDAILHEAARFGMRVMQHETRKGFCPQYAMVAGRNVDHPVMDYLRSYCIKDGVKRIPLAYLRNSREVRLQLLAGIIDTDGHLYKGGSGFEVTTKHAGLRDDLKFLARSLGFAASSTESYKVCQTGNGGVYHRVFITGDVHLVPTRLHRKQAVVATRRSNVLHSTFTVESLGVGPYAGVTLGGDHLYLLGDCTVTHNTYVALKQAQHCHMQGESVLFVTTEMGIEQLGRRHAAIALGINPMFLRNSTISTNMQRRMNRYYEEMAGTDRFRIFSVGMNSQVASLEAFMQEYGPTIVFIDGVYLLKPTQASRNMNRTERITAVYDELKALTLEANVPMVATTQFNRTAGKGGKEGSLENIGYTDAIGTHSSLVVALKYGPTANPKHSRALEFLKGREGEDGEIAINFKFAPLDMTEFTPEQRTAQGVAEASTTDVNWMA